MSTCPMMLLSNNKNTPPPSPLRRSRGHTISYVPDAARSPPITRTRARVNSFSDGLPPSPTIKMNMQLQNIPSIATMSASSTPPQSPIRKEFSVFSAQRKKMVLNLQVATAIISNAAAPPTTITTVKPSNLCVTSDDRVQPVATPEKTAPAKTGGKTKRKLGPGCGLLDWIRLCRKTKDLAGTGGEKRAISLKELEQHCTEQDAWTAIRGKVYNLTPYFKFHPGGKGDLLRAAGKDCTILFDEVHKWVNVESTLKACYIGPLMVASPNTQRKNSVKIVKNARRKESSTLTVAKPVMITDGVNKQAVPNPTQTKDLPTEQKKDLRTETQAAIACEEPDGLRQVSPESPIRPLVGENSHKKSSTASMEAAKDSSIKLSIPPTRHRRSSEPHPRFDWVQSEWAIILHVMTHDSKLKTSDVILDVNGQSFEAAIFMGDKVFELNIALAHPVLTSHVTINCNRVEISLKKQVPHQQWENIGSFREGHARLIPRSRRGVKYHETTVDSIREVTHDTKLFTLRLPTGSYLNVPTGHHLSIKANINGEAVERSYTPVSSLEASLQRYAHSQESEGEVIELMVKLYQDGKMSGFLSKLKQGDKVMVSDPEGTFDASNRLAAASKMLLIAAGSGFTPMVKLLRDYTSTELVSRQRNASSSEAKGEAGEEDQQAPELPPLTICDPLTICEHDDDVVPKGLPKTSKLLFANKKEKDVMYREELDRLSRATRESFTVTHILSDADKSWGGLRGRIDKTLLRSNLPEVNPDKRQESLVCICGPEPFTNTITNLLVEFDYPDECIHVFE